VFLSPIATADDTVMNFLFLCASKGS